MQKKPSRADERPDASTVPCGLPRRLLVMLYDALIVTAVMMLATGVLLIFYDQRLTAGKDAAYTLYLAAFWFVYLGWCWRNGGMTIGMRAWGVRLVADGSPRLSWRQCLIRFLVSLASALLLGAGFIWSLFDTERRTWHDRASQSRLRRTRR